MMQEEQLQNPDTDQGTESLQQEIPPVTQEPAPAERKPCFFVFNSNTLLGLILLAGLVVLYVLHFTGREGPAAAVPAMTFQKTAGKPLSVVYVNIDSLNARYEYVRHLRDNLEATGKRLQTEVLSEQAALEKEVEDFQKQVAANIISEERAKEKYELLMQKQQALMLKKERFTQQVAEQEMDMNNRLVDTVTAFLKRFNRTYQFDYIMGYKLGGEILVGNDTLDITRTVLEGLNKELGNKK